MKTDSHLFEEAVSSETLFQGKFLKAKRDIVRLPDGQTATREYVVHPGAVVVLPMLDDGRVVVERQFRYAVGQVLVEFPAGKLDPAEDPLECGKRELLEETGYVAREWARAGTMHLAVGYSTEIIHIYFARGLVPGTRQLDQGEFLDVFEASVADLLAWSRDGRLTDAKSLACLLWLQNVTSGTWPLEWRAAPDAPTAG